MITNGQFNDWTLNQKVAVAASAVMHRSGARHIIGYRYAGLGAIFTGHSVPDEYSQYFPLGIRTPISALTRILDWLRREQIEILTLDNALARLEDPKGRRFVVFTFDDGFKDNFSCLLPLMQKYNAPFTVFVTTHMVTRELYYWRAGLEALFKKSESVDFEPMGYRFSCPDSMSKVRAVRATVRWVSNSRKDPRAMLDCIFRRNDIDLFPLLDNDALTTNELCKLANDPLVTIGGHATSHRALSQLDEAEVRREIVDNRTFLECLTQKKIDHFAYPFGVTDSCGEREACIVKNLGFKSAVTARLGTLFPDHLQEMHSLPRCYMGMPHDRLDCFAFQLSGGYRLLTNPTGLPYMTM